MIYASEKPDLKKNPTMQMQKKKLKQNTSS